MVVIKDTNKRFLDRPKEVLLLTFPHKVGMDVLVYTPKEFKEKCEASLFFQDEIVKKGKEVYETN